MIAAVILAAGESKRMGRPKMLLPWGKTTVLGQVIDSFRESGVDEILVVTGGARQLVEQIVDRHGARSVFNDEYASAEMLFSLQLGLRSLPSQAQAALIGLGDQPQIQAATVQRIVERFLARRPRLIVPSFQRRRGHPWLVEKSLWHELSDLKSPQSPRDFLQRHAEEIDYLLVDNASVLADLDTPQDYQSALH